MSKTMECYCLNNNNKNIKLCCYLNNQQKLDYINRHNSKILNQLEEIKNTYLLSDNIKKKIEKKINYIKENNIKTKQISSKNFKLVLSKLKLSELDSFPNSNIKDKEIFEELEKIENTLKFHESINNISENLNDYFDYFINNDFKFK